MNRALFLAMLVALAGCGRQSEPATAKDEFEKCMQLASGRPAGGRGNAVAVEVVKECRDWAREVTK